MSRRLARSLAVAALALGACANPFGGDDERADDLAAARARWRRAGIARYAYDLDLDCFCRGAGRPVRVTVRGGAVVGAAPLDSSQSHPWGAPRPEDYYTVDGLFAIVERAVRHDARRLSVTYHPRLGYPVSAAIDFEGNVADDEIGWRAGPLTPEP